MDIVKLYTNPNGTIKAAQIEDAGESYPVLIEALGNTVLFPELIKGGWQLTALPLTLVKNGLPFESLPKAEWTPALEAQYGQDMYDMLGTPMTQDELRKYLYKGSTVVAFETMPSYKYNTRQEFLDYLHSIRTGVPDEDYLPLNCLVAPNARFTIQEFCAPENRSLVATISSRRNFSYARYTKLVAFLHKHGLPEKFNGKDFIQVYHKWGVDGVQFAMLGTPTLETVHLVEGGYSKEEGYTEFAILPSTEQVYVLLVKTADGYDVVCPEGVKQNELYNANQIKPYNAFTDEDERRNHRFELDTLESARASNLKVGEAMALRRHVRRPTYRLDMTVANNPSVDVVKVTYGRIKFGESFATTGFSFSTPANTPMSISYIGDPEAARESAFTMAIAKDIVARRKKKSNRTLVSALAENGFSMLSSLSYALTANNMGVPGVPSKPDEEGISIPAMGPQTLIEYVRAQANPEEAQEILENLPLLDTYEMEVSDARQSAVDTLDGFMNGTSGDHDLTQAIAAEDRETPDVYYEIFRALTSCTSLTARDIYLQMTKWTPGNPVVVTDGKIQVTANGSIMKGVETAYNRLKNVIRLNQAKKALYYVWVDGAIKALGDPDGDKHSGFFATVLDMRKQKCQEVREIFANYYVDKVLEELAPMKATDYARWNATMNAFVGNPATDRNPDYGEVPRMYYTDGVATYVAASMMMQFLKTGVCRLPLPGKNVMLNANSAPELAAAINSIRKFVLNDSQSYFCDCQSFCDNIISNAPGDLMYYFYPINAVITPDKVLPRPACRIMEYDGVFAYNYTTFAGIYENNNTPEKLPPIAQRAYLGLNELQSRDVETDLLYALLSGNVTGMKSYLLDYYKEALAIANDWKVSNPTEHLDGFTGPWEAAWSSNGVQPNSSGRAEPEARGLPGFRPCNVLKVLDPEKPVAADADSIIKVFTGVTAEEYYNGVGEFVLPARRGRLGFFAVDGDFITLCSMDPNVEPRVINAADITTLNPEDYPVHHIYGNRWVIRDGTGTLYSVEV